MKISISEIKLSTLHAMLLFVSTDETRYVLNGIRFEIANGSVKLIAADGRRLLLHEPQDVTADATDAGFIFPADILRAIAESPEGEAPRKVRVEYDSETSAIRAVFGHSSYFDDFTVTCQAIGGTYPSWRQVVPDPIPSTFPNDHAAFNGHFVVDLMKAVEEIDGRYNGVRFTSAGPGQPLIAKTKNSTAILMPLR